MRQSKNHIRQRERAGSIELEPEDTEDLWHLDQMVRKTDLVATHTKRKVKSEGATSTKTETVHGWLTVRVESHVYDAANGDLFVSGKVAEENHIAPRGSHHTLHIELNKKFKLTKDPRGNAAGGNGDGIGWDNVALDLLSESLSLQRRADTIAIVMDEGMANICVITQSQTKHQACIKENVPKKRAGVGASSHDKGMDRFYKALLDKLLRQDKVDKDRIKIDLHATNEDGRQPPLLLASPGFIAAGFQKYMAAHAAAKGDKALQKYVLENVLVAHSSGGNLQNLEEVLKSPHVMVRLGDTKFARQSQRMEKLLELLREDDGRAWYGPNEVLKAIEKGAVTKNGTLLVSSNLFKSNDTAERKKWAAAKEQVEKEWGGEVLVLSSAHESGKRLEGLSGVAAILSYPLLDLDEDEDDETGTNGHDVQPATNGQAHDREVDDADMGL